MKRRIVMVVFAFLFLFGHLAAASSTDCQYAQVSTPKGPLNLRKTASASAAIVDKIPNRSYLAVLAVNDTWCECFFQDQTGYVLTEYLLWIEDLPFREVSLNQNGDDVLALKEKLRELRYLRSDTTLDGTFDRDTECSIALFQSAHGLEATGIATPELQAFIFWGPVETNASQPYPAATLGSGTESKKAALSTPPPTATKTMTVSVTGHCSDYHHVGNDWTQYYSVNGQSVALDNKVQIMLGESVSLYSEITEIDKYPDVGSATQEIVITQKHLDDGFTVVQSISVKENKGRYKGNTAVWTVTYRFDP